MDGHFKELEDLVEVGHFVFGDEDERTFELYTLAFLVVDEVGRDEAAIELHAFDELDLVLQSLALTDSDHTGLADLFNEISQKPSNLLIAIG